ncbi:hypothetical protein [Pseudomonas sp. GD03944]|uniref:hypothetical protein n=1 Tax=Pseudomonas sp. GD03944 TaxID=2975409 RepID=UPI00244B5FBF|nr:hypothetical protein [Pseudomonas sp. GD03944]MDH1261978.1 hypothetical protein [Pseudomonas sp. GD03944]
MSLVKQVFGVERPSTLVVVVVGFFYVLLALCFYAWHLDFVMNAAWRVIGGCVSVLFSVVYVSVFFHVTIPGAVVKRFNSRIGRVVQVLFMALMVAFLFFLVVLCMEWAVL